MPVRWTIRRNYAVVTEVLSEEYIQGLHAQTKPLAYVITEVEILDQAAFNEFSPKVPATMQPFGGISFVGKGYLARR